MATNLLANLSLLQLRRAVAIKEQIAALEAELGHMVGTAPSVNSLAKRGPKKKMSAAARARIPAAPKARGTKPKGKPAATPAKQVTRKLSAKGRAKLVAAAKARWAKVKAAGKKSLGA